MITWSYLTWIVLVFLAIVAGFLYAAAQASGAERLLWIGAAAGAVLLIGIGLERNARARRRRSPGEADPHRPL